MKKYEVKTIEEAQKLAMVDFDLPVSALNFEVTKETKGFLGIGAKLEVEVEIALDGIDVPAYMLLFTRGLQLEKGTLTLQILHGADGTQITHG